MTRSISTLGTALLGAFVVALGGCGDLEQPVSPLGGTPSYNAGGGPDLGRLARFQARPQVGLGSARALIGPAGGRLDFHGFAIEVPAGAVDRVTLFTLRLPADARGSSRVVAEFLPHGARFAKPVAIELPYAGTSLQGAGDPTIVWWNGRWVDMGASVTADGHRLRTLTDHFSTYGTTDDRSGALAVSGG